MNMKAKICEIYVTTVVHEVGGVLMIDGTFNGFK